MHDPLERAARALEAERFGPVIPDYTPSSADRAAAATRVRLLEETALADVLELRRLRAVDGAA
jgi:hypothetical protein